MAKRPSEYWREWIAADAAAVAAGTLDPEEAVSARLFPDSLITSTDLALVDFERRLRTEDVTTDDAVFDAVREVVLVLNRINDEHGGRGYETGEREQLCSYIVRTLDEAGVDVDSLAAGRGLTRHQITDEWRTW